MELPVKITELWGRDEWDWIRKRAHPILAKDTRGFVAYRGLDIKAVVVFDGWTPNSCQVHIAIDDPFVLRHGLLEECCDFVFDYADREVMIAKIPAMNKESLRFAEHVGFKEVCRIENGYQKDVDLVWLVMRKHECRWLTPANRKVA